MARGPDRPPRGRLAAAVAAVVLAAAALVAGGGTATASRAIAHGTTVQRQPSTAVPQVRGDERIDRDEVRAVVEVGRWVVVGGSFQQVTAPGQPPVAQGRLVAYDRRTGALHPTFRPVLDGRVRGLAADGPDHVIVGGEFLTVDGVFQERLARFDLRDGTLDRGFTPQVDAFVNDVVVVGERVVIGGAFTEVGGLPRLRLAAVTRLDGAVDRRFALDVTEELGRAVEVRGLAALPDGEHVLVVHTGRRVAGLERFGAAVVQVGAASRLRGWRTRQYEPICRPERGEAGYPWLRDGAVAPDGTWAVIVSANGNFPPGCDTASRFPLTDLDDPDVRATWISALFDTPEAVAVSDAAVYVGGHFTAVMGPGTTIDDYERGNDVKNPPGSLDRFQLAALSVVDGTGLPDWRANADGVRGVLALTVTPHGLLAGSDGELWAQRDLGAHAFFPTVEATAGPGPAGGAAPRARAWGRGRPSGR